MNELMNQLTTPQMLETYSRIWSNLKEIIRLLFKTTITVFDTGITGPVSFSLGLFVLFLLVYWTKGRTRYLFTRIIYFKVALAVISAAARHALPYFH
ncbi:MAG: hypothetical protein KKE44_15805 [Proteobacteria bacterium]|nr:hypothetical protein [Pseudomonadota bacterium]MBU1584194.1 hypothetical protein [Pseudomonadota bacterium]MBU2452282.1 hypothetical protein [Pseudomonadota bacterium]MBU2628043.1 hypothetical protein [Pseudomonadota bacterium]